MGQNAVIPDSIIENYHSAQAGIPGHCQSLGTSSEDDMEAQFRELVDQWQEETGMLSSTSKKAIHPAYQEIIGMGEKAIPMILKELEEHPSHWFFALQSITGENPVPPEAAGYIGKGADAWIKWGREKGYTS